MSVYTIVTEAELREFLQRYAVGSPVAYSGIKEGIENTNYFVDTDTGGRYVLTIFEWQDRSDLPYFLKLMAHLTNTGLPCPHPVADQHGNYLQTLHDKPAALISRLGGGTITIADPAHCRQVGSLLASMHSATASFNLRHSNKRGRDWRMQCAEKVLPHLSSSDNQLLRAEISYHHHDTAQDLPRGIIHADLFRDNVLFENSHLSGVIDFYYACEESLIYDLAITVNDWCSHNNGSLNEENYAAMAGTYAEHRPFTAAEKDAWQNALRRAALRFWLSRLYDNHFPKSGQLTHIKDPDVFKNILLQYKRGAPALC